MNKKSVLKLISVLMIIIGIGVCAAGLAFGVLQFIDKLGEDAFFNSAEKVEAVCDEVYTERVGPRIITKADVTYSYESALYSETLEDIKGESLTKGVRIYVYISRTAPEDCRIPHGGDYYTTNLIFFGSIALVGIILFAAGLTIRSKAKNIREELPLTFKHNNYSNAASYRNHYGAGYEAPSLKKLNNAGQSFGQFNPVSVQSGFNRPDYSKPSAPSSPAPAPTSAEPKFTTPAPVPTSAEPKFTHSAPTPTSAEPKFTTPAPSPTSAEPKNTEPEIKAVALSTGFADFDDEV